MPIYFAWFAYIFSLKIKIHNPFYFYQKEVVSDSLLQSDLLHIGFQNSK